MRARVGNKGTEAGVPIRIAAAYRTLVNLLRALSGVIVFGVFALIVVDVFVRLAGLQPWLYSSILVEYGLLWFTMLAAPWLVRTRGHVFIDVLSQFLPRPVRRLVARLAYLICVVSSLVFAYYSLQLLIDAITSGEIDTRAVDMPAWALLLPIPFCFLLVAVEFGRYLVGLDSMYRGHVEARDTF